MDILGFLVGVVLLILGRRLFWLFVGCIGFAVGFSYGPLLWSTQSDLIQLVLAIGVGIVGAILAILFQKVAIALAGFAAGGYIAVHAMHLFGLEIGQFIWLPYILGGIVGAVLLFIIFDWALILLSSVAGASLAVQAVNLRPQGEAELFFVLMISGVFVQTLLFVKTKAVQEDR
jgi:hypothetical protein